MAPTSTGSTIPSSMPSTTGKSYGSGTTVGTTESAPRTSSTRNCSEDRSSTESASASELPSNMPAPKLGQHLFHPSSTAPANLLKSGLQAFSNATHMDLLHGATHGFRARGIWHHLQGAVIWHCHTCPPHDASRMFLTGTCYVQAPQGATCPRAAASPCFLESRRAMVAETTCR